MRGTMLVYRQQARLVELRGTLTKDVKFGGGILGSIKKGGTFQVQQTEVIPGQWKITLIDVHIRGRALIFHSIHERQHQTFSNFRLLPQNLSLAEGAAMLEQSPPRSWRHCGRAQTHLTGVQ